MRQAEAAWERLVVARETVGQILAEPGGQVSTKVTVVGDRLMPVVGAVACSVVPVRSRGLEALALAPECQRIMGILGGHGGAMDCRQLAVALGLQRVPAKVEGVRSKAKRLAARG